MPRLPILLGLLASITLYAQDKPPERPGLPRMRVRIPETTLEIEMVKLPPGKIELAPPKPGDKPRVVEVKAIWMSTTEVTFDVYMLWLSKATQATGSYKARRQDVKFAAVAGPSEMPYGRLSQFDGEGMPALNVGYVGATHACNWLFDQTDWRFRLPTEAEWEYACRAGGPPLENLPDKQLDAIAWHAGNSAAGDDEPHPHPVGKKAPNAWGLYDMLGNAAEWVQPEEGETRLFVKGGAWNTPASRLNSSRRTFDVPRWHARDPADPPRGFYLDDSFVGFRVVCDADGPVPLPKNSK
ncbi:MAG: formylglycine-generating enzyme family protein [Tepidisphaerales bacterium]